MVIDFNKKCGHCGHRALKHRDFTKTCKECDCEAFIAGGKPAPSVSRYTKEEQSPTGRIRRTEPAMQNIRPGVSDIAAELRREFVRLTNKKRGGKS